LLPWLASRLAPGLPMIAEAFREHA
jgi:hypothetical protein